MQQSSRRGAFVLVALTLVAVGFGASPGTAPALAAGGRREEPAERQSLERVRRVKQLLPGARPAREVTAHEERKKTRLANPSLSDRAFEEAMADDSLWVDSNEQLLYLDPPHVPESPDMAVANEVLGGSGVEIPHADGRAVTATPSVASAVTPSAPDDTFALHSMPGALRTIYLDFDGGLITGTVWNSRYSSFTAPPFSLDDDGLTFNEQERLFIRMVWEQLTEKFAPFAIDVTTEEPAPEAIARSGSSDTTYGTRAMFSRAPQVLAFCGCGGIAYVGAFNRTSAHASYQPAWVFNGLIPGLASPFLAASTAAHEVGHNLGLLHDGLYGEQYYEGDLWAPVMGGRGRIVQWSMGDYPGATSKQDDLAVMRSFGAPYRADDHGDTPATATPLAATFETSGLISRPNDIDVFAIDLAAGPFTATAAPLQEGASLDIVLELRGEDGSLVAVADPPIVKGPWPIVDGLGATVSLFIATPGRYYLSVRGTGYQSAAVSYPRYGSLGNYQLASRLPTLTVEVRGGPGAAGTVDSAGDLPQCSTGCTVTRALGTSFVMMPKPEPGSDFVGWENGSDSGGREVMVTGLSHRVIVFFKPSKKYLVSVTKSGSGSGSVVSDPAGISCGAVCSAPFPGTVEVGLSAIAEPGSVFAGWEGSTECVDAENCLLAERTGDVALVARFVPAASLSITIEGTDGGVTADSGRVGCRKSESPCNAVVPGDREIELFPEDQSDWVFSAWGGACFGQGVPCRVTMSAAKSVTASFVRGKFLNITFGEPGKGDVVISQKPLTCNSDCSVGFVSGTTVTLVAVPRYYGEFVTWTGACAAFGSTPTCTVVASVDREIGVEFDYGPVQPVDLWLSGGGRVVASNSWFECSEHCWEYLPSGAPVTLTPVPDPGYVFTGWLGSPCNGSAKACSISASGPVSLMAFFDESPFRIKAYVTGSGTGSVTSSIGSLACSSTCESIFDRGASVQLTATAGPASRFAGWSGSCRGTRPTCTVRMRGRHLVSARFVSTKPPSGPTSPAAVPGNRAVMLSWGLPESPGGAAVSDYVIEVSKDGVVWKRLADGKSTKRRYSVTRLANGVTYRFRIAARNKWATGPWTEVPPATPRTVPSAPLALRAVPGAGSVVLAWTAGATGGADVFDYLVEISTNGRTWNRFEDGESAEPAATVTGLTNGMKYWVRVAAVNEAGTGKRSAARTAVPVLAPPLSPFRWVS